MNDPPGVTRLAPSPTGALHLGNARTFLINWLLARRQSWTIHLRVDDLDGPRVKVGADRGAIDDLNWLGLDYDHGPVYQSTHVDQHQQALTRLLASGQAYACVCSRREVDLAASAPHADDGASVYTGTCRGRFSSVQDAFAKTGRAPAVRFHVPEGAVEFTDSFVGPVRIEPARQLGDFVIAKSDLSPAYQLAVVVDDASAGVTQVVRGDDLLDSTPRQILLYRALGMSENIPTYTHLPLVVGADGRRLAKRHGDTRLASYRAHNVPAGRMLALLARWCGWPVMQGVSVNELVDTFDLSRVPRGPVTMTDADDRWLRNV